MKQAYLLRIGGHLGNVGLKSGDNVQFHVGKVTTMNRVWGLVGVEFRYMAGTFQFKPALSDLTLAIALIFSVEPAAGKTPDIWVQATRPMLACGATQDDLSVQNLVLETLIHPSPDGSLPEGCWMIASGDIFLLDDRQSPVDTEIIVKMWAPVCPKSCVPSMDLVYAPPRRIVGDYLRPVSAPSGW